MNTLKITGVFFLIATLLCLGSCSKTGPAGPQGEQGPKGDQGPAGSQGIPGADGSTIYSGNDAPSADIGLNGDYYIDLAAINLYGPKTDAGWGDPLGLKGAKGDKGETGQKGDKGDTGQNGAKGDKGDPGQNGKDGSQILSGTSAPASSAGNIGDYYWNISSFRLYGPKTSTGWGSGIVLRGPKGDKGDPGTANVMYSDWLTFKWGNLFPTEGLMYIKEPKITLDFINHGGTILSYLLFLQTVGNDTITAAMYSIPQAIPSNSLGYVAGQKFNFGVAYNANSVNNIILDITGGATLPSNFLQDFLFIPDPINPLYNRYRFRYILIPGGMHLRRSSPPPDPEDYKAICEYYGIPE